MRERTKEKSQEESILRGRRQKEGLDAHHGPEGSRRGPPSVSLPRRGLGRQGEVRDRGRRRGIVKGEAGTGRAEVGSQGRGKVGTGVKQEWDSPGRRGAGTGVTS